MIELVVACMLFTAPTADGGTTVVELCPSASIVMRQYDQVNSPGDAGGADAGPGAADSGNGNGGSTGGNGESCDK